MSNIVKANTSELTTTDLIDEFFLSQEENMIARLELVDAIVADTQSDEELEKLELAVKAYETQKQTQAIKKETAKVNAKVNAKQSLMKRVKKQLESRSR